MLRHAFIRFGVVVAASAALGACTASSPPQSSDKPAGEIPQQAEKPSLPPETPAPDVDKAPPKVTESSLGETSVPFVLSVRGPDVLPDSGDIELTVRIAAPREFRVPGTLSVTLPTNAKLASGNATEALTSIPAGETLRTFKITLGGKLGAGNQIKIVLDAKDPGGMMGARAERLFPEVKATSTSTRTTPNAPPPPVGRPTGKAPTH